MSARTIIAAPVIWFGSWLLSVMVCSGCAAGAAFFGFEFLERDYVSSKLHLALSSCLSMIFSENRFPLFRIMLQGIKKGPERPHAHRLNLGWPQPPPAVRLGTTTIRSLVIILRIRRLGLPKGCAVIPPSPRKSREGRFQRDLGRLAAFRPFGEWEF